MKKGKVFGKGQIAVFGMVLALAAAVWLNVKYSGNNKFLGDVSYVSNKSTSSKTAQTSAKVKEKSTDYFETAIKERDEAYEKAEDLIKETLKSSNLSESEKQEANENLNKLSNRIATEQNAETILKAKGFEKAIVVLGDNSANVIVSSDELSTEQTLQIQDIILSETNIPIQNIKIVTVK